MNNLTVIKYTMTEKEKEIRSLLLSENPEKEIAEFIDSQLKSLD